MVWIILLRFDFFDMGSSDHTEANHGGVPFNLL